MFNTISVENAMGNSRDVSAAALNAGKSKYVYLNTSVGVPYNDFDPNFTPTSGRKKRLMDCAWSMKLCR